jgi:glutathione-regulated potassium-efflux system ancillary protein KefG
LNPDNKAKTNKILVLFAHPAFHKSRINSQMIERIRGIDGVTINDLYETYPDFYIDTKREKRLLTEHDIIVWHHPFYWYSSPAILKEWMDLVLEHGFAYGMEGRALEGKKALSVISTGGRKEVYSIEGRNKYTINQFLIPFRQSANLCRMEYLPPFVVHGSHTILNDEIEEYARLYRKAIIGLRDNAYSNYQLNDVEYLNDLIA